MDRDQLGQFLRDGQALFERIARLPMPTVAAINGDCLGGGLELALACTYRVAADDTVDQHRPAGSEARHPPRLGRHQSPAAR